VTRRTASVTFSCALNVAFSRGQIARNPCETVPPAKPPRPEIPLLDGKQVMKLLAASRSARDRALLTLAVTTGMRQGETFALTWDDLDLAARRIAIKSTLAEDRGGHLVRSEPKTPKSRRVIYLPEIAVGAYGASSGAPSGVAQTADRIFAALVPHCRKCRPSLRTGTERKTPNSLQNNAFPLVEMGGLEPPTPYMRSDSGAKDASTKKARKRRKAS
jgi:integrase